MCFPDVLRKSEKFSGDQTLLKFQMLLTTVAALLWTFAAAAKYPNEIMDTPLVLCEPERIVIKVSLDRQDWQSNTIQYSCCAAGVPQKKKPYLG